jgi:pilus assembly protein CpaF
MNAPVFGRRQADQTGTPREPVQLGPVPLTTATTTSRPSLVGAPAVIASSEAAAGNHFDELRTLCLQRLDPSSVAAVPFDRLAIEVERLISEIATENRIHLNGREQRSLAEELVDDMLGLGPLEPLLKDESIADIMVNGPDKVFVERRGKVVLSNVRFRDANHVASICQRIASAVGRRVDEASPMVDARLKDGSRVNIVFMPLALDGPYIAIRKFSKKPIDFPKLIEYGALTRQVARILEIAGRARLNIIISGGTGSGKTTMMNAVSRLIDPGERIVTIEDAAELQLQQPHVVRLETRPASLEGRGEITQRDLVRNALRMRPDRVIIGEVRGGEAFDMLQAMNTGHDGSMSTIHANNTRDALARIENMVQMGNVGLPSRSIRQQIVAAVDIIIQLERQRDGGRRVTQVTEVCGMEGDVVTLNDIFQLEVIGEGTDGRLARPAAQERLSYFGLDRAWKAALEGLEE